MSTNSTNDGLIAVISVEVVLFVCCVIAVIVAYIYLKRKYKKKTTLRPWPYVLPLYWYLSYYDSMVERCFSVEPRLKMFQSLPNPPEKIKPLVEMFAELEKEIHSSMNPEIAVQTLTADIQSNYPEKVAQLYDLDEMVKHYNDLKKLYINLECEGAGKCKNDTEDIESVKRFTANPDEQNQTKTKGAILLKEIALSLGALLREEMHEERPCHDEESSTDVDKSAKIAVDTTCDAKLIEAFEVGNTIKTKERWARERSLRKKRYRSGRFPTRTKYKKSKATVRNIRLQNFIKSERIMPVNNCTKKAL